jgi:hypothetical protein
MITQSEGSELGSFEGYEQTSINSAEVAPTSASTMVQLATRSCGEALPDGKGSVFSTAALQLDEGFGTRVIGLVHRSALASPHEYTVVVTELPSFVVAQTEKLALPSLSES